MPAILLIISIIPSIVLGYYIYKMDKIEKEPTKLIALLFGLGVLSIIPAVILEILASGLLGWFGIEEDSGLIGLFIYFLIGVGAVEEGCKWIILKKVTWNHKEFDHIFDALVYAAFVSLGFATLENILYVFQNGIGTGILRAILSVPGHTFFAIYMGYYYGIAKQCYLNGNQKLYSSNLAKSFLIPTLIHGLFDFLLSTEYMIIFLAYFALIIFLYITAFNKIIRFSKVSTNLKVPYANQNNQMQQAQPVPVQTNQQQAAPANFCKNCGKPVTGAFCGNCGTKV